MFVAYYRCSTEMQSESGLGLEAQRMAVLAHANGAPIVAEFIEVETGKMMDRPELAKALKAAKKAGATLAVAKLDRLSRKTTLVSMLLDTRVPFVACDQPHATPMTLRILAAVAEEEGEKISQRTREALAVLKAKGVKLGNPNPAASLAKSAQTRSRMAVQGRENVRPIIDAIRASGLSTLREIASALNARGIKTARGGEWHPTSVARMMA